MRDYCTLKVNAIIKPETSGTVRRAIIAVRSLDVIVRNKYANNVGKLAAWLSASHVEKAPKKKEPTP